MLQQVRALLLRLRLSYAEGLEIAREVAQDRRVQRIEDLNEEQLAALADNLEWLTHTAIFRFDEELRCCGCARNLLRCA